jgi:translocation and assembly module TamB
VEGTSNKPRISGTAQLSGGEVQDYPRSLRVHDIDANVQFAGDSVEIVQISGRAGAGTISASGSLDLAAPGMPVSLTIQARNAQPITSDQFRSNVDADIKLTGPTSQRLNASGTITIRRGETILPDGLPSRVATLNVGRQGAKAAMQKTPQGRPTVSLDLTTKSPGQFFVRGHGLEAELEGDLHIGGTDANPIVSGGLTMRRGTLDLAGQVLMFTTGRITFDGGGLRNRLDPTLEFTAETTSGAVNAKLDVTGYASAPKIQLSSTPQVPQDEILATLLFQQSAKQLSPFQLAQMAQAAASLGGFGGGGFDPIASVRRSLGLDRLSVSSASTSGTSSGSATASQSTVEAGKYVAGGVYVAAKQGLGNTTEAEVQVDLTKNLKAKATVNTGTNAASTQGAAVQILGSSVGLSYQFEY